MEDRPHSAAFALLTGFGADDIDVGKVKARPEPIAAPGGQLGAGDLAESIHGGRYETSMPGAGRRVCRTD